MRMLLGRNPYELLRDDPSDSGHIREYTGRELRGFAEEAGFEVRDSHYHAYFDNRFGRREANRAGGLLNTVYAIAPPTWRPGMTLELRPARASG